MFNLVRKALVACAISAFAASAANAATVDQFQAVAGGEMETVAVSISGDSSGFTAFNLDWTLTATPTGADATKQEFVTFPTFGFATVLSLSAIDQEFGSGIYRGIFDVITDTAGIWGDFALVEVTAPSLTEFTSGTLVVSEAELAPTTPNPSPIPLPAGAWLLLSGILGLAAWKRRAI